jgi:hypothetical protein
MVGVILNSFLAKDGNSILFLYSSSLLEQIADSSLFIQRLLAAVDDGRLRSLALDGVEKLNGVRVK